eukprot:gene18222-34737_t
MPITPIFRVDQTEGEVIVAIEAPHVRSPEVDFYVQGDDFKFSVHPLRLPGDVVEDGNERCTHDVTTGTFTVYIPKATPGEHFE